MQRLSLFIGKSAEKKAWIRVSACLYLPKSLACDLLPFLSDYLNNRLVGSAMPGVQKRIRGGI